MELAEKFLRLVGIMAQLRSANGCPWDLKQTHESLRQYLLEEAYEVLETIDQKNHDELRGELGDLLLQVVFHAQIASESGRFDIGEVVDAISDKMIQRHPHVFGDMKVESVSEQTRLWEELKMREGKKKSLIDGVPQALPALQRAARLQQKARASMPTLAEITSKWSEFEKAVDAGHDSIDPKANPAVSKRLEDEAPLSELYGSLLFALVGFGRNLGLNAEDALREKCLEFSRHYLNAAGPEPKGS